MSILKVALMGNPVLRVRAKPVNKSDFRNPLVQKLFDDMIDTMHEYSGVGLAAPQVHEGLRVFVALLDGEAEGESEAVVLVNPEITPMSDLQEEGWEGCLSIPDVRGRVPRFVHIRLSAQDRNGRPVQLELKGFEARVVQHETDHLDGVLFFDRMTSLESLSYLDEFKRYHAKKDDDEADVEGKEEGGEG
jgi:peptide deformylase